MKNAIFYLWLVASALLSNALLALLLAVSFKLTTDHGSEFVEVAPIGFGIMVLAFRLEARTARDMVTGKRLLVAFLACMWVLAIGSVGVSIVGGHYSEAITNFVCSLTIFVASLLVFRSAPEQWFGCNWRKVLKA